MVDVLLSGQWGVAVVEEPARAATLWRTPPIINAMDCQVEINSFPFDTAVTRNPYFQHTFFYTMNTRCQSNSHYEERGNSGTWQHTACATLTLCILTTTLFRRSLRPQTTAAQTTASLIESPPELYTT